MIGGSVQISSSSFIPHAANRRNSFCSCSKQGRGRREIGWGHCLLCRRTSHNQHFHGGLSFAATRKHPAGRSPQIPRMLHLQAHVQDRESQLDLVELDCVVDCSHGSSELPYRKSSLVLCHFRSPRYGLPSPELCKNRRPGLDTLSISPHWGIANKQLCGI